MPREQGPSLRPGTFPCQPNLSDQHGPGEGDNVAEPRTGAASAHDEGFATP